MTPNEYQEEAQRTVMSAEEQAYRITKVLHTNPERAHVIVGALKLCSESGELSDTIVKHICYGQEMDIQNIWEECGDLLWYIALILEHTGYNIDQAMHDNINKLRKRYPAKYSDACAAERLDKQ